MFLTATDQRKPQTALWRLLTLIITVVASIGLTATSASAATAITAHSSSGRTASVGLETRVGVTNQNLASSSARISTESPACVGENLPVYGGFVLASCVATNTGGTAAGEEAREATPATDPDRFKPVRGRSGKVDAETGEIWEKDKLHKDHYEVYKNQKDYDKGRRDRDVWSDGRPKGKK